MVFNNKWLAGWHALNALGARALNAFVSINNNCGQSSCGCVDASFDHHAELFPQATEWDAFVYGDWCS
jgi:hypothetical protein